MLGSQAGELIQTILASASNKTSGAIASAIGALMVLVTASGVFSEMQAALNRIWDTDGAEQPLLSMVRARAGSLGLVAALGFLMMASLAASAGLSALGKYLGSHTDFAPLLLSVLIPLYRFSFSAFCSRRSSRYFPTPRLPGGTSPSARSSRPRCSDGKVAYRLVPRTTAANSGYGAAGALILMLLWIYYSAQIFLFGAEIARAIAGPMPPQTAKRTPILNRSL